MGFPGGSDGKEPACNAGDLSSISGSGRSPGEGNGNPFQYSGLENPEHGGAWRATVHGVSQSRTRLSDFTFIVVTSFSHSLHVVKVLDTQLCPTLSDPMDCSPPGSSQEFSRQEYWSGEPVPSPGDLSDPATKPGSPVLTGRFFTV